ncbi:hypothetical protein DAEQUDRAFT_456807 [Daedalea quercina L-15889]|uniref:Uncharacterized protein n=1 Tax=Daedalea quercina L-15889 TaxID=1314783 RepID=A0A165N0M6_9APHY|nr:hypothetical protein DAEQUDRAFT_456807 [Daedalea quercina L-15889]
MQQDYNPRRSRSSSFHSSTDADVDDYLLPRARSPLSEKRPPYTRRRHIRYVLLALLVLVTAVLAWTWLFFQGRVGLAEPILRALAKESDLPPLYAEYHQLELSLPQHNLNSSTSDGQQVKYLWIANHIRGNGWGNAMQDLLLNAYLAYRAGRSFVFNNYTWSEGVSDYSLYNFKPIPSRIPLTALIKGPIVGAPFAADSSAPRAVVKDFWDLVCPNTTVIQNVDVLYSIETDPTTTSSTLKRWLEVLDAIEDPCVEVAQDPRQIFDIWLLQDASRLLDEWPAFSQSPMLTEFGWSPLVELAFDMNREMFAPSSVFQPYLSSTPDSMNSAERYSLVPGLMAVHIRRGDFVRHCRRIADWRAKFFGYNDFPSFPDKLAIPEDASQETSAELYRTHCFPEIPEIVQKIEGVRRSEAGQGIENIYIMTNGPSSWTADLKNALRSSSEWNRITSSRDILVNHEQEYVKQAVDILIGQRAQVFIGNGFSSMTGQVSMLRVANGFAPNRTRFW